VVRADHDLVVETEPVADASGDDDPHPIVDVDDGGHAIRPPSAAELPVVRASDADHDRTVAEDDGELRDTHPVAADEAPNLVPPNTLRGPDRRRPPDRWGHSIGAAPSPRGWLIHVLRSGIGPETQSGHLKHSFRGHLPREWWARGDLNSCAAGVGGCALVACSGAERGLCPIGRPPRAVWSGLVLPRF